jgi:putative hemolysin
MSTYLLGEQANVPVAHGRTGLPAYPTFAEQLPGLEITDGRYAARFARTREELDQVLKLRFEVFNLELGEGLESSFRFGRDLDQYDEQCHHLIVVDTTDRDRVVGTYRMQTSDMALEGVGFYSDSEFRLSELPGEMLSSSVELGRACVAESHRNTMVLFMLWKGLAAYVLHNRKRFLFGCCSITSQDPNVGARVLDLLDRSGELHPSLRVSVRPGYECLVHSTSIAEADEETTRLPKLFRIYMRYGARVCSPPAIDREFKTIDFLVMFDAMAMDPATRGMFFGE